MPQRKPQPLPESAKNRQVKSKESTQRSDYESTNSNAKIAKVIEPIANKWFPLRKFIEVFRLFMIS